MNIFIYHSPLKRQQQQQQKQQENEQCKAQQCPQVQIAVETR